MLFCHVSGDSGEMKSVTVGCNVNPCHHGTLKTTNSGWLYLNYQTCNKYRRVGSYILLLDLKLQTLSDYILTTKTITNIEEYDFIYFYYI